MLKDAPEVDEGGLYLINDEDNKGTDKRKLMRTIEVAPVDGWFEQQARPSLVGVGAPPSNDWNDGDDDENNK
jgi:hypothetical protein